MLTNSARLPTILQVPRLMKAAHNADKDAFDGHGYSLVRLGAAQAHGRSGNDMHGAHCADE